MRLQRLLPACLAAALAFCVVAAAAQGAAGTASAPVIHEKFTPLACPRKPRTTLQLEGCAEHRVLTIDRQIDTLNARIFAELSRSRRGMLVTVNTDWLRYRDAACTTAASIYSGGSLQAVAYANCLGSIDGSHVIELRKMATALSPGG